MFSSQSPYVREGVGFIGVTIALLKPWISNPGDLCKKSIMSGGSWYSVEDGVTLGQTGSENGIIIRDEEHSHGARITLEKGGNIAPFSITCGVYGVMFHTRFFADEAEGQAAYDLMKLGLASIALGDASKAPESASAFVTQFP